MELKQLIWDKQRNHPVMALGLAQSKEGELAIAIVVKDIMDRENVENQMEMLGIPTRSTYLPANNNPAGGPLLYAETTDLSRVTDILSMMKDYISEELIQNTRIWWQHKGPAHDMLLEKLQERNSLAKAAHLLPAPLPEYAIETYTHPNEHNAATKLVTSLWPPSPLSSPITTLQIEGHEDAIRIRDILRKTFNDTQMDGSEIPDKKPVHLEKDFQYGLQINAPATEVVQALRQHPTLLLPGMAERIEENEANLRDAIIGTAAQEVAEKTGMAKGGLLTPEEYQALDEKRFSHRHAEKLLKSRQEKGYSEGKERG